MSYVIHIWDQPTPATWAEARSVLARLVNQPASPHPRFAELARRMHVWTPELAADWTLDAPDGVVDQAVWSLALAQTLPDSFYPRLIDQAVSLGLSVYDEQAGECFVPGPWRMTVAGREPLVHAPVAPRAPSGLLDVQGRFRALVLPRLQRHGFALETPAPRGNLVETHLVRPTTLGDQRIHVDWMGDAASHYVATVISRITPQLPEAVAKVCAPQTRILFNVEDTPQINAFLRNFSPKNPTSRSYLASGVEGLDVFMSALGDWLLTELVPVLDHCKTLDDFLAYELGEPRSPIYVMAYLANLALAYVAGVPDLDARFDQLMQRRRAQGMNPAQMAAAFEALRSLRIA